MSRLRLAVGLAGLVCAVLSAGRNDRALAWIAIGLIGLAILLRLVGRRRSP